MNSRLPPAQVLRAVRQETPLSRDEGLIPAATIHGWGSGHAARGRASPQPQSLPTAAEPGPGRHWPLDFPSVVSALPLP